MPVCKIKNKKEGIQISWDVVSGAKGYVVYRRSVGGKYKKIKTLQGEKNCVYVDTKVSDGVTYLYTVRAFSDTYKSDFKSAESCKYIVEPVLSSVKQITTGISLGWKYFS